MLAKTVTVVNVNFAGREGRDVMARGRIWTENDVQELINTLDKLKQLEEDYRILKLDILKKVLGPDARFCQVCGRTMIWRRLWNIIPQNIRDLHIIARRHNQYLCQTHYTLGYRREHRTNGEISEEIARLRAAVGFNPNRNYDKEESDEIE